MIYERIDEHYDVISIHTWYISILYTVYHVYSIDMYQVWIDITS